MNSAEQVAKLITDLKAQGKPLSGIAWEAARACVGWPYIFGARWQYCTPANRRARYSDEHPTIKSACKNYSGSGTAGCSGCKWLPGGKLVRINDCRGFTYGILKAVYNWELQGAGCTSQWNKASNWKAKGTIDTMPKDTLCCLFVQKGKTMEHTGFGLNNETVECSSGVQHFTQQKAKWTHWAVPACIDGTVPEPAPSPEPAPETKPTLRKGSSGSYVTLMQTMLIQRGFSCGSCGADGKFGSDTQYALKKFQQAAGLGVDGVCGAKTWAALESADPVKHYTVTISGLTMAQAEGLKGQYKNATIKEE